MRREYTIGAKLTVTFAAMMVVILLLSYASLSAIGTLGSELDKSANVTGKKTAIIGQIQKSIGDMRVGQRGVMLYNIRKEQTRVEAADRVVRDGAARVQSLVAEVRPLLESDKGRAAASQIADSVSAWMPVYEQIARLCAAQDLGPALDAALDKTFSSADSADRAAEDLAGQANMIFKASAEKAAAETAKSRWWTWSMIIVALCTGVGVVLIIRNVNTRLRQVAAEMADSSAQVASAAGQVSSSGQSLAGGATEQAASLEETSASTEEISSMTRKNAENSREAARRMGDAATRIEEANRTLAEMMSSMKNIRESSDKISKIIKVIDEIAFQTNILALNAAVEAARAGSAGMGFAVVAEEVRNLAQRSAQAAKDTASLIEESIARSGEGARKLDEVAVSIHSVTDEASKAKVLVEEVHLGSEEQSRGIEQIAKAIAQMEQVTQKNASNAEESAAAGEELNSQAVTMRSSVDSLRRLVGGTSEADQTLGRSGRKPRSRSTAAFEDAFSEGV